jgi:hypothetical protein
MPMVASQKPSNFVPAPEGVHAGVLVDIVDLGMQKNFNGDGLGHKCRFVWEIEAERPEGGRYLISETYTVSLHEKANLRKALKSWRGKDFTTEELASFDLEKLIGVPCTLVVSHNERQGRVYANVQAITKATEKRISPSGKYNRRKDRADWVSPKDSPWADPTPVAIEDSEPAF